TSSSDRPRTAVSSNTSVCASTITAAPSLQSAAPERPHLDRPDLGDRGTRRDLDGLLEAVGLDEIEAADRPPRLREPTRPCHLLPAAHADGAAAARRRELVASHPLPSRLQVVQPRKALRLRLRARLGLRLVVHPLGVPTDQQQVPHLAPLVVVDVRTTDGAAP